MHIIHVASELAEVAKAGGLGDVIYGLSKAQIKKGHEVDIILPKYDCIHWENLKNLKVVDKELWVTEGSLRCNNTVWKAQQGNLSLILIEPHHPHYYFSRGTIYGEHDDIDRFTYFSKAAAEYLHQKTIQPDVLHIHDWPTAVIAPLYKEIYSKEGMKVDGIVLTIHNLQYQGKCAPFHLSRIGLNGSRYLHPERMQDPYVPLLVNLLKGGMVYADEITTVSPTFEKEIQTPLGGFGLHDTLQNYSDKLTGILNGIDENYWNPQTDPHLKKNYPTPPHITKKSFQDLLTGKEENKRALRKKCHLADENKPLVASITRMVSQKGPELILSAIERTLENGGQFVLLGSLPEEDLLEEFNTLKKTYPEDQLSIVFDHDEQLAHLIYAGADILVVPSLFEPCGLTQMIAMRYGTLPVVRKTGGLADTVYDVDTSDKPKEERNGFSFDFPDKEGVHWALDRALTCHETDIPRWHTYMLQALRQDFSWTHTEPQYLEVYEKAIKQ